VNSNAFAAGINAGDRIVTINGVRLSSWKQLTSIVTNNPNTALHLEILHGDSALSCVITPIFDTNGIPRLGLMHTNKLVRIRPFKEE
jgi:membrane-associated protease RseP (regulator of RpoE activity)